VWRSTRPTIDHRRTGRLQDRAVIPGWEAADEAKADDDEQTVRELRESK
jgi:hypothetical protein